VRDDVCNHIIETVQSITLSKEIHDAKEKSNFDQLTESFFTICVLYYLDRNMHQCLKNRNVTHEDIMKSFDRIVLNYKEDSISDTQQETSTIVLQQCIQQNREAWKNLYERLNILNNRTNINGILQEFMEKTIDGSNSISILDTDQVILRKIDQVEKGICHNYALDRRQIMTEDNMINMQTAMAKMGYCEMSTLCAKEFSDCLKTNDMFTCVTNDPEQRISKCVANYHRVWNRYHHYHLYDHLF
jgi:hypothetical protein